MHSSLFSGFVWPMAIVMETYNDRSTLRMTVGLEQLLAVAICLHRRQRGIASNNALTKPSVSQRFCSSTRPN